MRGVGILMTMLATSGARGGTCDPMSECVCVCLVRERNATTTKVDREMQECAPPQARLPCVYKTKVSQPGTNKYIIWISPKYI